ncbi:amino acid permease [Peribacillus sp. SCS-155]|uniref:amino acid permease n=1 Tax=Peribacillus sedimenti TaxID=3115297 RepID=UPI0039062410
MNSKYKLGFWILTALVTGNMVGSGIFMLPSSLAKLASPGGVLAAWGITGFGVLMLALVFGNLAIRKPELTGGPQIYAKELFRPGSIASLLSGFMSSWGYWIGNFAGNVAIITTFAGYLSAFFPILTNQAELFSIGSFTLKIGNAMTFIVSSILLWGIHFIILKGLEGAGKLNFLATATKVLGFMIFIIVGIFAFQKANILPFVAPKTTDEGEIIGMYGQISSAAVTTLWAFIGIESAMVFASRAKKPADVKRATILGLIISLAIYIGISTLVMGMLSPEQLMNSGKPLSEAIESVAGPIGGKLLAVLACVSMIGSTIGWVLLSAEVPHQAAKQGLFLPAFLQENKKGIPVFSLVLSNGLAQLFLFSTISSSISEAFNFVIFIATLAYLIPYFISAVFQVKLVFTGETYNTMSSRVIDGVIGALATLYSLWVIIAGTADLKTFMFGVVLLASGIVFYKQLLKNPLAAQSIKQK